MNDVLELRLRLDTQPHYRIGMHNIVTASWLTSNGRGHWAKYSKQVGAWRDLAGWTARARHIPPLDRAYILAELRFPDLTRRDPANWYPTVKACVDGLIDVTVLPDDDATHLVGPDIRLGPVSGMKKLSSLILHIWRLS